MNNSIHNQFGIGLPDLLSAIAIITISLSIGVPAFNSILTSSNLTAYNNEMVRALNMARSESVKRGYIVAVCKSSQATVQCNNAASWENGWVVFVDRNDNQSIDDSDTIIETFADLQSGYTLSSTNFADNVRYRPDGRSNTSGNFYLCSTGSYKSFRKINVSATGRIRSQDDAEKNYDSEQYDDVC